MLRIDHIVLPVADLASASVPFERLGLVLTPPALNPDTGNTNRAAFIPNGAHEFFIELLLPAAGSKMTPGAASRLVFATGDMDASLRQLASSGFATDRRKVHRADGSLLADSAIVAASPGHCEIGLVAYPETPMARVARHRGAGLFASKFRLLRPDHLAVIVHDRANGLAFWNVALGLPVIGEIAAGPMSIIQLDAGGPVIELLLPATPGSPLRDCPEGLASMVAFEVADLDAAIVHALRRRFSAPAGEAGVIPHTRRSTIPASECAGLGLPLLEYVNPTAS